MIIDKKSKFLSLSIVLVLSCMQLFPFDEVETFKYKTPFGRAIKYCFFANMGETPAFIALGDKIIFQPERDAMGSLQGFDLASYTNPTVQLLITNGKVFCLRWVISVGANPKNHYIVDFSMPKPNIIGPFGADHEPQGEVKRVIWREKHALIEFMSSSHYVYHYATHRLTYQPSLMEH